MYEFKRPFLLIFILLVVMVLWSLESRADSYNPYAKVSLAYILFQPKDFESKTYHTKTDLYDDSNLAYGLETGVSVPTETGDEFHIGIYWYDLLNEGNSSKVHRPYFLETFTDYVFKWDDKMYVTIGAGYKILQDNTIQYKIGSLTYRARLSDQTIKDNLTARFAIGRSFGKYSLSLEHHSQWLNGKPFNTYWEYHSTTINLAYTF